MVRLLQEDVHAQARTLIFEDSPDIAGKPPPPSMTSKPIDMFPVEGVLSIPNDVQQNFDLETCRFIRSTLAMNVVPFVRGQTSAKALWQQLERLYGEQPGVKWQGGRFPSSHEALNRMEKKRPSLGPSTERSPALESQNVHCSTDYSGPTLPIPVIVIEKPKKVAFNFASATLSTSTVLQSHAPANDANLSPPLVSGYDMQACLAIPRNVLSIKSSVLPLSARRASQLPRLQFDIDQSFTQGRKADKEEKAAAGIEMKSLMLGKDYETPGFTPTPDEAKARSRDYFQR